jgi:DNA-binding NarL/FixJ family response regulator
MSFFRILVVEDHESFRGLICQTLAKRSEFQVICQVSDGLEAVRKAEELQPDLIVLDIGLPGISGLEAARRIRKSAPDSKILFLSLESDVGVVEEALRLGAGFVGKKQTGIDLLAAVDTISQGRQFVSPGLLADRPTASKIPSHESTSPLTPEKSICNHRHEVQFYSDDVAFVASLAPFIANSLKAGNQTIVVATEPHRNILHHYLVENDLGYTEAVREGLYISIDAAEALSAFMDSSGPNRTRFRSTFSPLIRRSECFAEAKQKKVVVFGEMVAVLCAEGKTRAAIELERLWNELLRSHSFHLRCAYPTGDDQTVELNAEIRAEHCAVVPALQ